jgi:hypothetical protein
MMHAIIAKALVEPTPTTDATSERYLAVALGYPTTWRVSRQILSTAVLDDNTRDQQKIKTNDGAKENSSSRAPPKNGSAELTGSAVPSPIPVPEKQKIIIQDVIYAGNPKKGVDRWYCHETAMVASVEWEGNSYAHKGGHLTKIIPKFTKGDAVEVKYGKKWFAAKISKKKEAPDGIR